MPIRTASMNPQIRKNGAKLHVARSIRLHSQSADAAPSAQESALLEERRALKAAKGEREAAAKLPKVKAAAPVKTVKAAKAPKAAKPPKPAKEKAAKSAKNAKPSRAEKSTKKAENAEAAKKADRKSASKT
jgi:hypothetical protein